MVCHKEIGPVSREKKDPKFKVIIILHKQETESPTSLVHTKNESGWWVEIAFKHVQTAYAHCCDAAQTLRAWIGSLKITITRKVWLLNLFLKTNNNKTPAQPNKTHQLVSELNYV